MPVIASNMERFGVYPIHANECRLAKIENSFSHMRLRKPTGSLVLDRSIRDGDLARGIHALLCESKQSDATLIVGIVPLCL